MSDGTKRANTKGTGKETKMTCKKRTPVDLTNRRKILRDGKKNSGKVKVREKKPSRTILPRTGYGTR